MEAIGSNVVSAIRWTNPCEGRIREDLSMISRMSLGPSRNERQRPRLRGIGVVNGMTDASNGLQFWGRYSTDEHI